MASDDLDEADEGNSRAHPVEYDPLSPLQWATVSVTKAKRGDSWAEAPVAADGEQEAPF